MHLLSLGAGWYPRPGEYQLYVTVTRPSKKADRNRYVSSISVCCSCKYLLAATSEWNAE